METQPTKFPKNTKVAFAVAPEGVQSCLTSVGYQAPTERSVHILPRDATPKVIARLTKRPAYCLPLFMKTLSLSLHSCRNSSRTAPAKSAFNNVLNNQVDPLGDVVEAIDRNVVAELKSWNQRAPYFSESVSTPVQSGGTPFTM